MADSKRTYRIFLSAAEPSADIFCANLITALRQTGYDIEFVGAGGQQMAQAGCNILWRTADRAVMIYKAFPKLGYYYRLIRTISAYLKRVKPDLVIVCDSPSFNFHIAKSAHKAGIPTLFYVAPQLWAWAGWRIRKLRKYCTKLACTLPFEQQWFTQRGVNAEFVGHPFLDNLSADFADLSAGDYADFNPENAKIALLPGSRRAEIASLWHPMQRIALRISEKYPGVNFTTVAVDAPAKEFLKSRQIKGFRSDYCIGSVARTASAVDFAIVASGSATLQLAAAGCPMVIMYQSSRILWHLFGRWLLKTRFLSLINILAGTELVPEFMPYFASIEPIVAKCQTLMANRDTLIETSRRLIGLAGPLAQRKASERVAQIVFEMLA